NGGQCDTTSLKIISGETVSALPTPVREGFDFLGWFDENGGEFTAETAVTADITVTAKWAVAQPPLDDLSWEIESYLYARYRGRRVSLHNVPYTLYHDYETEVALLNGEVVVIGRTTNYYGEKWLLTEEGDWVKESDVTKIEDLMPFILSDDVNYPEKLHLSYTSCKLYGTVTSLSGDIKTVNGGIFDADGNRVYGTTVTVDAPTFNISKIDDYIAFRSLGAGEYYYRVIAENNCGTYNVINYAFTVVDEYPAEVTITFKDESLSNVSSELTVARGNTVDELPTPTKSGYIFEGWVDEDGKVITAATAVTYNMTAIPVWVRRIGDVNFDDATDAADVILLEQFILGLIDESEIPDVNGDGIVDSADTVVIQMAVLGFN
ncbi:MAG: InlB B-repeat-containing protein, partial [Clostridia bacterium]|nr:InlB B-repeat-containing protein [Clostridia bacterium]